jgi:dipeptidase E
MVMTPSIGEAFVGWTPPTGGDETLVNRVSLLNRL